MNLTIHQNDDMFIGDHKHYAECGRQLADFCEQASKITQVTDPIILELPCGYGRVTRHLADRFNAARIHVADIMKPAVDFSQETFGVVGHYIEDPIYEFSGLDNDMFDVALMGSLITHLSEDAAKTVMKHFFMKVKRGGVGVVTTHGVLSRARHAEGDWYQVGNDAREHLMGEYDASRFGFVPYRNDHSSEKRTVEYIGASYGVSLIPEAWMRATCAENGLKVIEYIQGGWDNHQDVFLISRS
ncbi:class I SAM-dependent methyltransferase [Burkholderia vietnamiensis]|uniref:Class I SAM-dependent methyltransferase n=1 Tax=Burkholderia vietnamiensis TaxID=60552 RepID=A0AA44Y084_BURVI|nr:class I SAM-dependent methyltransferase [Burkholderia vietnamiensis]PRH41107.1 class I SAM-dependent methyltransferase [Burkholderia vietnamiensis]